MRHLCATKRRLPRCAVSASYYVWVQVRLEDGSGVKFIEIKYAGVEGFRPMPCRKKMGLRLPFRKYMG